MTGFLHDLPPEKRFGSSKRNIPCRHRKEGIVVGATTLVIERN